MRPSLVHLELLHPEDAPRDPGGAIRAVVTLDGAPVGILHRGARTVGERDMLDQALTELRDAVAIRLAASRLEAVSDGPEQPQATIVVCTRDRADRLEGCLAALAEQRYPSYEVVVVDNAPQDDTTRLVAEHWS
ncbi:MAG: glycosyltransferase family 2 protein, partial [Gaiellaceae bacterium]